MSGVKDAIVTVTASELRRLREQAARSSSLQNTVNVLNQLDARNQQALANYQSRMNTMNSNMANMQRTMAENAAAASKEANELRARLQQTVADTNIRFQNLAREHEQQIQGMRNDFQRDLSQVRTDVANAMETNNRRIEEAMNRNNRRIQTQMDEVHSQIINVNSRVDGIENEIGAIHAADDTYLDMAREYANMARTLVTEMNANLRPEVLLPGRIGDVETAVSTAEGDVNTASNLMGGGAAARISAREAYTQAQQLYQELLEADALWNLRYQAACQAVNAAQAQIEASRQLEQEAEDGIKDRIDVDYWTDGDLSALSSLANGLSNTLEKPDDLTIEVLEGILQAAARVSEETDDATVAATVSFYGSQDRADIASDIAMSLYSRLNLQVVDQAFQGGDRRGAHRLHLRNENTGFEMYITQTPALDAEGNLVNHLESDIVSYGSANDMATGDQFAREAIQGLADLGLGVGSVDTVPGYECKPSDRTDVSMDQWGNGQCTTAVSPVHHTATAVSPVHHTATAEPAPQVAKK